MSDDDKTVNLSRENYLWLKREASINNRPLLRHLGSVVRYLGIGALVHAWLLGPAFEPNNLWGWGYVLAWPLPLAWWLFVNVGIWLVYTVLLLVVVTIIWWVSVDIMERRERRRRRHRNNRPDRFDPR